MVRLAEPRISPWLIALASCAAIVTEALGTEEMAGMSTTGAVEIAARLPTPLGNATFTEDGRIVVTHHPLFETAVRVSEVTSPTTLKPFPNELWNTPRPDTEDYFANVLGVRTDANGVVWLLDMGYRTDITPKLVAWNMREDRLERIVKLPEPATHINSEPNDFVIDEKHGAIYIADEGVGRDGDGFRAALIVVDLESGAARRVLEGHASTRPEDIPIRFDGRDVVKLRKDGGVGAMRAGADGIALDHRSEWLYYGPLNESAVYRIQVADLLNHRLGSQDIGSRVERYADRPNARGMSIDAEDNLYLTEVEHRAVGIIPARDRTYRRLVKHSEMTWPDGLSTGADGRLYVTVDQLPRSAPPNGGRDGSAPPYLLKRFTPLRMGRLGH